MGKGFATNAADHSRQARVDVISRPHSYKPGAPVTYSFICNLTFVRSELFMFITTNMRFSIVAIACVLASLVSSQTISQDTGKIPLCSLSCLSNAITNNGCSLTDYVCQCGAHRSAISQSATPCIVSSCNTTEALSK
jgi:hypothetical protein